jgi:hypothetical protein
MPLHPEPTENLSVYHQNNGLLFQFVLEEFLAVIPAVDAIRGAYQRLEAALVRRRPNQEVERLARQILSSIASLTGSALVNNPAYPWTPSKGSLGKLKHYVHLLRAPALEVEELTDQLKGVVNHAYHGAMQARDVLWQLGQRQIVLREASDLFRLLNNLIDATRRIEELLPSLLLHFRNDENVVYFLIRRAEAFDSLHQDLYVSNLLRKMYEDGLDEAREFLKGRYRARGFKRLAEQLDMKIFAIKERAGE